MVIGVFPTFIAAKAPCMFNYISYHLTLYSTSIAVDLTSWNNVLELPISEVNMPWQSVIIEKLLRF